MKNWLLKNWLLGTLRIYYRYFLLVLHHGGNTDYVFKCALPIFEGLFLHDTTIQHLLFTLASWHSLAKIRMHTDTILDHMDVITTQHGHALCQFVSATCAAFVTHELPHEVVTHAHCHAKAASSDNPSLLTHTAAMPIAKTKQFNLATPKLHFLDDYVSTIQAVWNYRILFHTDCESFLARHAKK